MPVYIEKLMVTLTDQPTNQPTGRIQGNLPFRKLQNRKKADICNYTVVQSIRVKTEYYRVLQGITGYHRVLRSITEYYRVLQGITEHYRGLQSITRYQRVLQNITKYYIVLQSIKKTNLAHLLGPIFGLVFSFREEVFHEKEKEKTKTA